MLVVFLVVFLIYEHVTVSDGKTSLLTAGCDRVHDVVVGVFAPLMERQEQESGSASVESPDPPAKETTPLPPVDKPAATPAKKPEKKPTPVKKPTPGKATPPPPTDKPKDTPPPPTDKPKDTPPPPKDKPAASNKPSSDKPPKEP